MNNHPTPEDHDHLRDLRKHDWRPGDPPEAATNPAEQALIARFMAGEDDTATLVATMIQLEMDRREAERAAYAAEAAHYGRVK